MHLIPALLFFIWVQIDRSSAGKETISVSRSLYCARNYAVEFGNIFGDKYQEIIFQYFRTAVMKSNTAIPLNDPYYDLLIRPEDKLEAADDKLRTFRKVKNQLVLDVGPGSSGTRTLFLAAAQLNITAYHCNQNSLNCVVTQRPGTDLVSLFHPSTMKIFDSPEYSLSLWGDNPVSNIWWELFHRFPPPCTELVMTDMDSGRWLAVRRKMIKASMARPDFKPHWLWTSPLPFHPDQLPAPLRVREELLNLTSIARVSEADNHRVFEAFRALLKCAAPNQALHWLVVGNDSANNFWANLTRIFKLSPSREKMEALVSTGIPYFGSKGCFIGGVKCNNTVKGVMPTHPNLCSL
jgi:hypothetical protein